MSLFCWWGRRNNQSTNVIYDTTELIYKENFENRIFPLYFFVEGWKGRRGADKKSYKV